MSIMTRMSVTEEDPSFGLRVFKDLSVLWGSRERGEKSRGELTLICTVASCMDTGKYEK